MIKNKCKLCNSYHLKDYGETLHQCHDIPGITNRKRHIFRCLDCRSIFIDPIPNVNELSYYYDHYARANIGGNSWPRRNCLPIILQLAKNIKRGKVLDIGCGDGSFLDRLPASLEKYGVELSENAYLKAISKGIKCYCASWDLAELEPKFDLVIALDFIEHVTDPYKAIKKMGRALKPGGFLVIETGNADSLAAKLLGKKWHYTYIFGHLVTLSPKALIAISKDAKVEPVSLIKGYHSRLTSDLLFRTFLGIGLTLFRMLFLPLRSMIIKDKFLGRIYDPLSPGLPLPDHMIFLGKKKV